MCRGRFSFEFFQDQHEDILEHDDALPDQCANIRLVLDDIVQSLRSSDGYWRIGRGEHRHVPGYPRVDPSVSAKRWGVA
jgi:hypothetical protein